MADEESRTVELKGISSETSKDTLENYFSSARRGGDISDIQYDKAQRTACIIFEHAEGAAKALETAPHIIEGATLTVQRKQPETHESNKLYTGGIHQDTTEDCLRYYIERICGVDVVEITRERSCNAIITVEGKLDFDMIHQRSKCRPLDGNILTIKPVPVCKTILVTNLPATATSDSVLYKFESRKSKGGDVEKVDFNREKRTAVVKFKDANVVDNVLSVNQKLDDTNLAVCRYYPLLAGVENKQVPKNTAGSKDCDLTAKEHPLLASRKYCVEIDRDLYDFLLKNHPENLKFALKNRQPTFDDKVVVVTMETNNSEDELRKFLKEFKHELVTFDPVLFHNGLQSKMENILHVFQSSKAVSFLENYTEGFIKIVGRSVNTFNLAVKEVNKCVDEVKNECEEKSRQCEDVVKVVPIIARLLHGSAQFHASESAWKQDGVEVRLDDTAGEIVVHGPGAQMSKVKSEVDQLVRSLGERKLEPKPSLLLASSAALSYVKELLQDNNLDVELSSDDSDRITLHGITQAQVDNAYLLIISAIREFSIPLSDTGPSFEMQNTRDEFVNEVGSSTPISMHFEGDEVKMVCLEKNLTDLRIKAAAFLDSKKEHVVRVPLEKAVARYFKLHGEMVQGLRLSSPGITIDHQTDAMVISGPKPLVANCQASFVEVVKGLISERIQFGTPETCASITGETAEKIILGIEQARKCAIVVNIEEKQSERVTSSNINEMKEEMSRTLQCRYIYPNGRILEIHQGDILNHPADYIVNSANEELKHAGGLAKAIVDKGGYKIQEDCHNFLREKGKLKLMPGDVVTTDGGKLLCKKVLHVVVPKWSSNPNDTTCGERTKEERYLRHACHDVLNNAGQGRTVAIPVLGTGIYQIPHDISARSLMTAADEFMRTNTSNDLKEVHFVDNDPKAIEALMKEIMEKYGSDFNFEINERVRNRWIGVSRTDGTAAAAVQRPVGLGDATFRTKHGTTIQLTIGNIAHSQDEVIVNTVNSDMDLTKNPCSKALCEVGGKKLADHCEQWVKTRGKLEAGAFAVTHNGNLKCTRVFHVCCPHWQANSGEKTLRELVQKLLSEAQRQKMKSIAIPALGTGSLKYPEEIVAKVLFEKLIDFSVISTTLKHFNIVVYNGNTKVVETFKEKFRFYSEKTAPESRVRRTRRETTERPNMPTPRRISEHATEERALISSRLKVEIVQGNMVQESTDAIAFLIGNSIKEGGQLGQALLRQAGETLEREYKGIKKVESGTVVMTSAGNLKAKCLLHMVPKVSIFADKVSSKGIKESVIKCLDEADSLQLKSIALPAVGTGALKKGGKESAEIVHESISEYLKHSSGPLELIRIVILQPNVYEEFQASFLEKQRSNRLPTSQDTVGKNKSESASRVRRHIFLDIVTDGASDVHKIKDDLSKIEQERCQCKNIDNELLAELPKEYLEEILELQNTFCVLMECKPEMGFLRLSGLSENVANASTAVYEKIFAYERIKHSVVMASHAVQWLFYDDRHGAAEVIPEEYDADTSAKIEKAYQNKDRVPTVIVGDNPKYEIDFTTMIETNISTRDVMKVFRRSREGFPLPECWDCQPIERASGKEVEVYLANVDNFDNHEEYDEIYNMFQKTMPNATVKRIQRIQNPRLYQIYKGHQKKMNERGSCNEQKLFHGTTKDTLESINNNGFNRSYCGKNATRFGRGVYFARNAKYSSRRIYAVPDGDGIQYMYVARVLVGQYTKGKENLVVPPPIDANNPTVSYDTVVDAVSNPQIFVVFYDYQCYPDYLITFKNE